MSHEKGDPTRRSSDVRESGDVSLGCGERRKGTHNDARRRGGCERRPHGARTRQKFKNRWNKTSAIQTTLRLAFEHWRSP